MTLCTQLTIILNKSSIVGFLKSFKCDKSSIEGYLNSIAILSSNLTKLLSGNGLSIVNSVRLISFVTYVLSSSGHLIETLVISPDDFARIFTNKYSKSAIGITPLFNVLLVQLSIRFFTALITSFCSPVSLAIIRFFSSFTKYGLYLTSS